MLQRQAEQDAELVGAPENAPAPRPSPTNATNSLVAEGPMSKVTIRLLKKPKKPVAVQLSGPREIRATIPESGSLSYDLQLEEGNWRILVMSEGCQNFKLPIEVPGIEEISISLQDVPHYWEKKQQAEQRRQNRASALRVKKAKEADAARKRQKKRVVELAEREAAEARNVTRSASEEASEGPSAEEFSAAIYQTKAIIKEELSDLDWPEDDDPAEFSAMLAERLGEEGTAGDFEDCFEHLRYTTTATDEEMAKLTFITRNMVRETTSQSPTLLEVAQSLCQAVPARAKDGSRFDLSEIAAIIIFTMAYVND